MDDNQSLTDKKVNITSKIDKANKILILASRPIDYDCLGTSLLIRWFLKEVKNKEVVNSYVFSEVPNHIKNFPGINLIEQRYVSEVDFDYYDLIIMPDGNEFRQFLTNDYKKIIAMVDSEKFISIDHHPPGKIEETIPDSTFRKVDSCTAKVFYENFIKPENTKVPQNIAQLMYMALVGDTGNFSHAIYSDTFAFAQELIEMGAEHYSATDLSIPKDMMEFTTWAIQNTEYYPKAKSTILKINGDTKKYLADKFGEDWEAMNLIRYYMNIFMRMVEGYPYSLIMTETVDGLGVKVIYRVKNFNADIDLTETLAPIGFELKGHPKAGGGLVNNTSLESAVSKYLGKMEEALETPE